VTVGFWACIVSDARPAADDLLEIGHRVDGKLIRANVYLSPKVKLPWFSPALLEAEVNHPESQRGQRQLSFTFLKRGVLS